MRQLSFKRHRFPLDIIRHSIWLYARFTLSFRDVEEMLAERGLDVRAGGDRRPARLAHTFRGLLGAADVAIGGGYARSLAREQQRGLSPYATARARDQGPLAGQ